MLTAENYYYLLLYFFLSFCGFIDRTVEDTTLNRERERGSDMQQRDPGRESNPGPLQSLGTWDAHSTHRAEQHPTVENYAVTKAQKHTTTCKVTK